MFITEIVLKNPNNIINLLTVYSIVMKFLTNFKVGESIENCEIIMEIGVLVFYYIK